MREVRNVPSLPIVRRAPLLLVSSAFLVGMVVGRKTATVGTSATGGTSGECRSGAILREERVVMRKLSVPEKHQLRVARDTLKMSDVGALIMGGPTKSEACQIILKLTGRPVREDCDDGA